MSLFSTLSAMMKISEIPVFTGSCDCSMNLVKNASKAGWFVFTSNSLATFAAVGSSVSMFPSSSILPTAFSLPS